MCLMRLLLFLALSLPLATPSPALAKDRIALVVGNSDYASLPKLRNAVSDAVLMGKTLESIGFSVYGGTDLTRQETQEAISAFISALSAETGDSIGLVYYAGHGVQYRNDNYLIPISAEVSSAAELIDQSTSAIEILTSMAKANKGANILILDACRNNPFKSGDVALISAGPGLAPLEAVGGTFVAYSTAPGLTADDGAGAHSPFTAALADFLTLPGQSIDVIMKLVGSRVRKETGGQQTPWTASSLTAEFVPLLPRLDKASHVTTTIFDEGVSYLSTYRVFQDLVLICGATLIIDGQANLFRRREYVEHVRHFYSLDHFVAYYGQKKYNVPYFCQLYCSSEKAIYCRDVEVLKALWDPDRDLRLSLVYAPSGPRGKAEDSSVRAIRNARIPILGFRD